MPRDTVSVQHYSATIPVWRYLYAATKLPQAIADGWRSEGVAFLAFGQQQVGTVPIYRHVAPHPWRYQLSTKAALGNGWSNEGVAFYAYAQPQTKILADPAVGNGWMNEGPAFHALVVAETSTR